MGKGTGSSVSGSLRIKGTKEEKKTERRKNETIRLFSMWGETPGRLWGQ